MGHPPFEETKEAAIPPSAVFLPGTLLYVEISKPVQGLDRISRTPLWSEIIRMSSVWAEAPWESLRFPAILAGNMKSWSETSVFRSHLNALAGRWMAIGFIPVPGSEMPGAVIVLRGNERGDPFPSLAWMVRRIPGLAIQRIPGDGIGGIIRITGAAGKTLFSGYAAEEGVILATPPAADALKTMSAALFPEGIPSPPALSGTRAYRRAMTGLPASPNVRCFVNVPRLLGCIESFPSLPDAERHLAKAALGWIGSIGIAKSVDRESISTWTTGRILRERVEIAAPGLLESLSSIDSPLSVRFPMDALLTYEAGVPPSLMLETLGFFMKEVAPALHRRIQGGLAKFRTETGLDPEVDLFPFLDRTLAAAWLPSGNTPEGWPFPRAVIMMRVRDPDKVERFLEAFTRWCAGAVAPLTEGFISAMVTSERHERVEIGGIELESVFGLPLPSPAFAQTEGLLIVSPVRSAVTEAVSALHGNRAVLGEGTLFQRGRVQPGSVEIVYMNFKNWEKEWDRRGGMVSLAGAFLLADGISPSELKARSDWLKRAGEALFRVLGTLDRATGSTTVGENGRFTFFLEARPFVSEAVPAGGFEDPDSKKPPHEVEQ